jgi:hypothetical protein
MGVRLALWIPLGVALFSVPRIVMATAQGPAALLTEDSRLWIYVFAPVAFALILGYVVSVYAAWMAGPARLPRPARAVVGMNRLKPMPEAGLVAYASGSVSPFGRSRRPAFSSSWQCRCPPSCSATCSIPGTSARRRQ